MVWRKRRENLSGRIGVHLEDADVSTLFVFFNLVILEHFNSSLLNYCVFPARVPMSKAGLVDPQR